MKKLNSKEKNDQNGLVTAAPPPWIAVLTSSSTLSSRLWRLNRVAGGFYPEDAYSTGCSANALNNFGVERNQHLLQNIIHRFAELAMTIRVDYHAQEVWQK